MSERPAIYISDKDFDRLSLMLDEQKKDVGSTVQALSHELDRASLVKSGELADGTVAMNSVVISRTKTVERNTSSS